MRRLHQHTYGIILTKFIFIATSFIRTESLLISAVFPLALFAPAQSSASSNFAPAQSSASPYTLSADSAHTHRLRHIEDSNPHIIDPDMPSQELRKRILFQVEPTDSRIDTALNIGERLLNWLDLLNSSRTPEKQLRLTSPKNRISYPISQPNRYSPTTVEQKLNEAKLSMPEAMRAVLFTNSPLPILNPVSDEDFVTYGRLVDRVYQTAARWSLLIPYKRSYISNRVRDVRGYYFLKTNNWNANSLQNWSSLDTNLQNTIREALVGVCINGRGSVVNCERMAGAIQTGENAVDMYNRYFEYGELTYNRFFEIQNAREDIKWSSTQLNVANIGFVDPDRQDVRDFLKLNLEDEYKWNDWGLKIDFTNRTPAPYIVFTPGATANVNGLGGNRIEMDANKSLNEYEEQWTIRHEFGHVLGFPDCYHEFFDTNTDEFVNYQIDTTDLMCSRAGNFNARMFQQMKAAYAQ